MVLSRYVYRDIGLSTFLTSLSLVLILAMYRGAEILQEFASEGLDVYYFFLVVVLALPELLELLLVVGFLVGMLSFLQRFRTGKEILIVWFAGCTPTDLLKPLLKMGVVVGLLVWGLSFYLAPLTRSLSDEVLQDMLSDRWGSLIKPGRFVTFLDGLTVYANSRSEDGVLRGVVIEDARDENNEPRTFIAEEARLGMDKLHLLVSLSKVHLVQQEQRARMESLQIPLRIDLWSYIDHHDPTRLDIHQLYQAAFPQTLDATSKLMQIDFHRRMTRLLMVLTVSVVAAGFLFLAPYARSVQRYPVVCASCVALFLELGNLSIQKFALDGLPAEAPQRLLWLYVLYLVPLVVGFSFLWFKSRSKIIRTSP